MQQGRLVCLRYLNGMVMQELSVVSGRDSFLLFEQAAEIHGILIPNDCGDLGDVI